MKHYIEYVHNSLLHPGRTIKSICPVLGKSDVELKLGGECSSTYQNPVGKELAACYVYVGPPFITIEPLGGSDLLVLEIFAKKFKFSYNIQPADLGNWQMRVSSEDGNCSDSMTIAYNDSFCSSHFCLPFNERL